MLRKIIHAFILNRLHITISAPAVMWCWSEFLKIHYRGIDYLIITLAVACICQWNRLTDEKEDAFNCPDDLKVAQAKSNIIRIFCLTAGAIVILLSFFTEPTGPMAALIIFGAAVGFFYSTPLIPSRPHLRLKDIPFIKNLSSGAGWSAGLLIFPMLRVHAQLDELWITAFLYMFAMVTTYEMMWDLRDIEGDAKAGLRTLPAVLGINSVRILIIILQCFCFGLILNGLANHRLTTVWSVFLFPNIIFMTLIIFFHRQIGLYRNLSHALVIALSIYACVSGLAATMFG